MTDNQNTQTRRPWQEPTVSVQAFIEPDTKITVERVTIGDGCWLSFKGDETMTGVSLCFNERETVEVLRDYLSAYLDGAAS